MGEVILMSDLKRRKAERKAREHIGIKPEMLWEVLPNNSWKGQRCFIIGGGFSLNRFDYSLLKDDLTIGINRAFEKFNPTISFFSDTRFWGWLEQGHFGEGTKEKFKSQKIKVAFNYIDFPYPDGVLKVNEYQNDYISFDLNNGIMLGDNSGFAALNLAICLGANPIYLLGFDMKNINGRANWHEGYPEKAPGNIYDLYLKHFERNAGLIKERGFKVINLNPKSELKCFEFGNIEDVFKEEKKPLYMEGYAGIGDNFWQRPFIKEICKDNVLYLMTFTPQIYWDIPNLKFIRTPYPNFDSHNKIADRLSKTVWSKLPDNFTTLKKPSYWLGFKYGLTISDQFESLFKITDYDFSFPVKEEWIDRAREILSKLYIGNRKICIIRFPVNRKEWKCPAREPKPEYLQMLVDRYKDEYYFISLAEMSSNNEYFIEEPQNIDKAFHKGELSLGDIFGLVKLADMVIAGNCFLLPMALAIGTKTFAIFGGCQHPELFLDKRMDLSNFAYVLPEPFCNCLNPGHDCKKDISEGKIITAFENLKSKDTKSRFDYTGLVDLTGTYTKENLLIYKVGRIYHQGFKNNEYLNRKYNLIFEMNIEDIENYIKDYDIKAVISVDYPPERVKDICKRQNINYLFCEAFLGQECVFDRIGAHFSPYNEIKEFVEKTPMLKSPNIPTWTKVKQPKIITKREMYRKYGLNNADKYIIILGQEIDDKSLIFSKNENVRNFQDYINLIVMNNLDIRFLFKPHPVYKTIKAHKSKCMDFVYNYKNVIVIDENIQSLFNIFTHFTAFSSTTIFEGLMKNKKFATVGYHFCDDDRIVLQLRKEENAKNLYRKISEFEINQEIRNRYIYFLCNYYSIPMEDKKLVDRLEMDSTEYYRRGY